MRLQRGKLALREVLTTTCGDDALAYGLIREAEAGWMATRIWCPHCGAVRLTSFTSVTSATRLDVVLSRNSLEVIHGRRR
jgi:hypothetical protein